MKYLNNLEEILSHVNNGKTVFCGSQFYTVTKNNRNGEYYITSINGHSIGLWGSDKNKLNGKDFYILESN